MSGDHTSPDHPDAGGGKMRIERPAPEYVLVPREPTEEMIAMADWKVREREDFREVYREMLAVAPPPPSSQEWRSMDSAPKDGTEILIRTRIGAVSGRYDKGAGWSDSPLNGREYEGPTWVCYDDAFQLEIEETPHGEICNEFLGWMPLPAPPAIRAPAKEPQ